MDFQVAVNNKLLREDTLEEKLVSSSWLGPVTCFFEVVTLLAQVILGFNTDEVLPQAMNLN